jgi:hypothetical protein
MTAPRTKGELVSRIQRKFFPTHIHIPAYVERNRAIRIITYIYGFLLNTHFRNSDYLTASNMMNESDNPIMYNGSLKRDHFIRFLK